MNRTLQHRDQSNFLRIEKFTDTSHICNFYSIYEQVADIYASEVT